jgi:alkanesulfonate monooxygenase SsuD/methylene tetrahydromethanopterin reductase-like flavin-dependent oxidoreductase (luciferase family)
MPVQRPIPLFMGGLSEPVLERAARIADGWFPIVRDPAAIEALAAQIETLKQRVKSYGRDPDAFEIRVQTGFASKAPDDWAKDVEMYKGMGVDFLCFSTMGAGLAGPRDHIDAMRRYKEAVG